MCVVFCEPPPYFFWMIMIVISWLWNIHENNEKYTYIPCKSRIKETFYLKLNEVLITKNPCYLPVSISVCILGTVNIDLFFYQKERCYIALLSKFGAISFQAYVSQGITHPVFYGDLVYKLRWVKG